jgi:hypothetical protein
MNDELLSGDDFIRQWLEAGIDAVVIDGVIQPKYRDWSGMSFSGCQPPEPKEGVKPAVSGLGAVHQGRWL